MRVDTLTSIRVFRRVVESGSFVAAADRLDLSAAMPSRLDRCGCSTQSQFGIEPRERDRLELRPICQRLIEQRPMPGVASLSIRSRRRVCVVNGLRQAAKRHAQVAQTADCVRWRPEEIRRALLWRDVADGDEPLVGAGKVCCRFALGSLDARGDSSVYPLCLAQ